ncbi:unnamed protein product [Chrysodeixis includens]|uniref:C2H2-type domain-containing protein n=1 Tax=Chrysodeixis includens TaxID=689277 RepID=A0A9P0C1G0_CHRIL|nr:unnamed protein product [Chrysodeixis includens]
MDDIKKLCCTCLCRDRQLFQLCRLYDGVNILYSLLSYDSVAYKEGFFKEKGSLYVCWECKAILYKIARFRQQACFTQRQLTMIADGRTDIKTRCLSNLTYYTNNQTITIDSSIDNDFIDCGKSIKSESEEDIPLSELTNIEQKSTEIERIQDLKEVKIESTREEVKKRVLKEEKRILKAEKREDCFTVVLLSEREMQDARLRRRMSMEGLGAEFKCDSCLIMFESKDELVRHNGVHEEKPNQTQCYICLSYINKSEYEEHRSSHYKKYICKYSNYETYNVLDMITHLKNGHDGVRKKSRRIETKSEAALAKKRTPFGYLCIECNKYFEDKNHRWKHIQREHREGHKCSTCGKRFNFRNGLKKHELIHTGGGPRIACPICQKMVREDLMKTHNKIHSERETFTCVECNKVFASRASYEYHIKYTQTHAQNDILKYKCTYCEKGYRSQSELKDHTNYTHLGKTRHKCPICGKALATQRCITRHVRRAHDGVKERVRDQICQQCGRAFGDKKTLREHELIHTGERPLSCEICGCTFRQSASLYTHRRRVHKVYPSVKTVTWLEGG